MSRQRSRGSELDRATCKRFFRSESWELERRRRAVESLDIILIEQLQELELRRKGRTDRLQKLDDFCKTIDECFPQFEKFMQTVHRKHQSSLNRYKTQDEFLKVNRAEVDKLTKEREFLSNIRAELQERLEGFSEAKKYLLKVKKESHGKFPSVQSLISAFAALFDERKAIFDGVDEMNAQITERQEILNDLLETDGQEQLKLLNHLCEVEEEQKELESKVRSLQREFVNVHELTANKCIESGKLEMAYKNLYAELCKILDPALYVESSSPAEQKALIKIAFNEIHKLRDSVHYVVSPKSSLAGELSTTSNPKKSSAAAAAKRKQHRKQIK